MGLELNAAPVGLSCPLPQTSSVPAVCQARCLTLSRLCYQHRGQVRVLITDEGSSEHLQRGYVTSLKPHSRGVAGGEIRPRPSATTTTNGEARIPDKPPMVPCGDTSEPAGRELCEGPSGGGWDEVQPEGCTLGKPRHTH